MTEVQAPPILQVRRNLILAGSQILTAIALGLPLSGCQENTNLGRSQLILISDDELDRMCLQAESDIRRRTGVSRDYNRQRRLERIAENMSNVPGAPKPRRGFRVQLLASNDVNAFALPNGYSGYYNGLFDFTRNDSDEVAQVMGHEMGHVSGRHGQERMSQLFAMQLGARVVTAAVTQGSRRQYSPAVGAALGLGVQLGGQAFSREHEYEADRLGLIYATRAGYRPDASLSFWDRMEARFGSGSVLSFLSTHPSHGDRKDRLRSLMTSDREFLSIQSRSNT